MNVFRWLSAMLIVVPGLLSAQTIACDQPPLIATSPQAGAELAWSMAVDPKGPWLAVGAHLADPDSTRKDSGSVALYKDPQPGARPTIPELVPADLQPGDQLGASVSISEDWLAVGAPVGDGRVRDSGVIYLFHQEGGTWAPAGKLEATDAAKGARFGASVSLHGDVLAVGAPGDSSRGSSAGAAYVFTMEGNRWTQKTKLLANDGRPFDEFGSAVATDGNEIVVGAPFADDLHVFQNFGAAYVFQRNGSLEENGKLTAGEFRPGNIQFGAAVAIRDGRIVAGAPGDDLQGADSGSAYAFEKMGTGWRLRQISVQDPGPGEQFGASIQLEDGRALIGARFDGEGSRRAGAAYLFDRTWTQNTKFYRHSAGGGFGQSVAILDNDRVFLGGFWEDVGAEADAGAVAVCPFGRPKPPCTSSITKTDNQSTVQRGQTVTYQIDIVAALPGSMVTDPFPSKLEMVGWCRGKDCKNFVQKPLVDTLPTGGDVSYRVRGRVRATATGQIKNEVFVKGNSCEETDATDIDQISAPPELSCVKTGPEAVNAGDTVTYTIVVSNEGEEASHDVILKDPDSPGLQFVSASAPCGSGFPCNRGTIQPHQSLPPVTVTFRMPTCPAPNSVTNTASVEASDAPEKSCSMTTAVRSQPEIKVSLSAPSQVSGGDAFKLSALVTNTGSQTAGDTAAEVFIGASAIVTGFPVGCGVDNPAPVASQSNPNHFICLLGDLSCGDSKTLDFMVRAPECTGCVSGSPIDFTAEARSQTPPTAPDIAMTTVPVTCPRDSGLTITKTDSPDPVVPGQAVLYTITVQNTGAAAVSGAVVKDEIPPELRKVLWCRGAGCTPILSPPLEDTIDLAAGETRIYRLSGIVKPMCSGVLHNKATVTPPSGVCDDPSDNQDIEDTQVVANGVHAFCEGISGPMMEMTPFTKTFLLINCGPANQADNPGDEFTDTLPAGLTLTGASATSGLASTMGNTAKWNGAIPVGGTVTITMTGMIDAGTVGMTFCNQATIAYDADGDGTNESTGFSDDPDEPGPADPCCFRVLSLNEIPALSGDGLAALALLLAGLAILRLRRRLL